MRPQEVEVPRPSWHLRPAIGYGSAGVTLALALLLFFKMPEATPYTIGLGYFCIAYSVVVLIYTVWSNWAWNRQKSASQVANKASGSPSE